MNAQDQIRIKNKCLGDNVRGGIHHRRRRLKRVPLIHTKKITGKAISRGAYVFRVQRLVRSIEKLSINTLIGRHEKEIWCQFHTNLVFATQSPLLNVPSKPQAAKKL